MTRPGLVPHETTPLHQLEFNAFQSARLSCDTQNLLVPRVFQRNCQRSLTYVLDAYLRAFVLKNGTRAKLH